MFPNATVNGEITQMLPRSHARNKAVAVVQRGPLKLPRTRRTLRAHGHHTKEIDLE